MRRSLQRFLDDERGATALEYGLLATLISLVVIAAVTAAGNGLWTSMNAISNALGH